MLIIHRTTLKLKYLGEFGFTFYSGRNGIRAPSRKNALFGINITQELGLLLICRFFKISLMLLPIQSTIFSLVSLNDFFSRSIIAIVSFRSFL
jgi:hypothetical protein